MFHMYATQGLLTVITITGNYHYRMIFSLPLHHYRKLPLPHDIFITATPLPER